MTRLRRQKLKKPKKEIARTKKTLISDLLHYPISLTMVEKSIVSTTIFNRLHNVKQNSTGFLTFPSLNHSRFSHSLGAMHLAGELFYHGLLNAKEEDRRGFLATAEKIVDDISQERDLEKIRSYREAPTDLDWKKCSPNEICKLSPVLSSYVPYFLAPQEQIAFLTIFQAVRIAALVHDLGHPPFSHVTEYALIKIKREVGKKKEPDLTAREKRCLKCLEDKSGSDTKLHELLTQALFEEITEGMHHRLEKDKRAASIVYGYELVLRMSKRVLSDAKSSNKMPEDEKPKTAVLSSLHSLISSEFDADRLDYVQRDLVLSGIREGALRPQRLIELFELSYVTDGPGSKARPASEVPKFLPNARAIRSLEEFFSARYELYRSVIYHHHVIRTDGLLEQVLIGLALRWLGGRDEQSAAKKPQNSPADQSASEIPGEPTASESSRDLLILTGSRNDIRWLWEIFEQVNSTEKGPATRNLLYSQWDDHWLMSLLRQEFIRLRSEKAGLTKKELVLYTQLEELVANKRSYVSIIKRAEDFFRIEEVFMQHLSKNRAARVLKQMMDKLEQRIEKGKQLEQRAHTNRDPNPEKWLSVAKKLHRKLVKCDTSKLPADAHGAIRLANMCVNAFARGEGPLENRIQRKIQSEFKLLDAFFVRKPPKPGFEENFQINTANGVVSFAAYSDLARELLARGDKVPAFYLFVLPKEDSAWDVDRDRISRALGRHLAEAFLAFMRDEMTVGNRTVRRQNDGR